jgi:hypothetical protein
VGGTGCRAGERGASLWPSWAHWGCSSWRQRSQPLRQVGFSGFDGHAGCGNEGRAAEFETVRCCCTTPRHCGALGRSESPVLAHAALGATKRRRDRLVVDRPRHRAVAVTAQRVVPGLHPLEDGVGQLVSAVSSASDGAVSNWTVPKKLAATLLPKESPIDPIDPSSPAARSRRPKAHEVYRPDSTGRRGPNRDGREPVRRDLAVPTRLRVGFFSRLEMAPGVRDGVDIAAAGFATVARR